jgi:serine/threonine protein kinase
LLRRFVEAAVRSRLLARESITLALAQIPHLEWSPGALAERLIQEGHLTRFQAEKLMLGRATGLQIGPYRLLYPIGRGGMGIVYLAADSRIRPGRAVRPLVALKVLPPGRARREPRTLARFQREMEIGRQFPHCDQLVRTLDSGNSHGVHYLALEYVSGRTVKQLVSESGPLSVPRAARIFAQVSRGLHAIHQAGYVHRDLKPANVIVSESGLVKLLDFGFALRRGETPHADPALLGGQGYTLGTLDYLAPEQAQNATAVGAETDIYSLGCSLYVALSGRVPFPDGTPQEKIRLHRKQEPLSLHLLNPAISEDFSRLVSWMMAKRPEQRPQSAQEVAAELDRWAEPLPPAPPPLAPAEWVRATLQEVESRWLAFRSAGVSTSEMESDSSVLASIEETPLESSRRRSPRFTPEPRIPTWLWFALGGGLLLLLMLGCLILGGVVVWWLK